MKKIVKRAAAWMLCAVLLGVGVHGYAKTTEAWASEISSESLRQEKEEISSEGLWQENEENSQEEALQSNQGSAQQADLQNGGDGTPSEDSQSSGDSIPSKDSQSSGDSTPLKDSQNSGDSTPSEPLQSSGESAQGEESQSGRESLPENEQQSNQGNLPEEIEENEQRESQENALGDTQEMISDSGEQSESQDIFYIQEHAPKIAARSFNNASQLPVSNVRYDHFLATDGYTSTASSPNLGVGVKYIEGDDKNVDGGGKWRYVYCLQFAKDSPAGGLGMQYVGWANRKISYALYYGAVYYGYMCRYSPYSTGNWQMDYFVTQMAIHVLNDEFTMEAFRRGLNRSAATQAEKDLVYNRVEMIVNDANNPANYGGFTSDGWLDMSTGSFSLSGYQDTWTLNGGNYISGGVFHPVFKSYYGYEFCEQITGCEIQVPSGVSVRKKSSKTYADFDLAIMENQYRQWQLTGKTIPVTVKITIPRYWGGGIYRCMEADNFQEVCFLTWGSEGGTAAFSQTANLHITKTTQQMTIDKKDAQTGKALSGAVFSLWAYDGTKYSKKVGTFQDQKNGSYVLKGIDYTAAIDGQFLIKEESPPASYASAYQPENAADAQDLEAYGGRTIKMSADGFSSDKVTQPLIFKDEKLTPQAKVSVMKYDIDTGAGLMGAEFAVYEWSSKSGAYRDTAVCTLDYDAVKQKYVTVEPLVRTEDNAGKFLVKEVKLPDGYHCGWSEEIVISEPGTTELELTAPNYPGRNFTFIKRIRRDEIVWAHGNPTFFFRLWGTDLDSKKHQYYCHVEFTPDAVSGQRGEYVTLEAVIRDIPAGIYQAEETEDTLRYLLTSAGSEDENVRVEIKSAGAVNGTEKITANVTADLRTGDGSVTYENRKVFYDELSDNTAVTNHFVPSQG